MTNLPLSRLDSVTDPISTDDIDPGELPPFDFERAEAAIRELLLAAGENPNRDGLQDTPARVARMYAAIFAGLRQRPEDVLTTTFDIAHDELVLVRDIELWSQCEHHLVPFFGRAHVGYIPADDGKIKAFGFRHVQALPQSLFASSGLYTCGRAAAKEGKVSGQDCRI